ncbi:MAG: M56 family metallopeptidase [Deltaproteobacteria bacterium]|nr:M56 family metallopeptidase [Deltaproteobacteria bacterium]
MYLLLFSVFLITGSLLGLAAGIPLDYALEVIIRCKSIVALCLPYASITTAGLLFSVTATIFSGFIYALFKGGAGMVRGRRLLKNLPVVDKNLTVSLIKDDNIKTAFTQGLLYPRIYLSTGLIGRLTRAELKSVMLHEIHHRKERDPLRFFCLSFIKNLLFYIPAVGLLTKELREKREKTADDNVVSRTKDPLTLASALLKAAMPFDGPAAEMAASIHGKEPLEERIERLVTGKEAKRRNVSLPAVLSSVAAAFLIILTLSAPALTREETTASCKTGHCAMHEERLGKECKIHCVLR